MSDSVTKWHEMQTEVSTTDTSNTNTYVYESPDGGKTVRRRIMQPEGSSTFKEIDKKQAYRILCDYDPEVIRLAYKLLEIG